MNDETNQPGSREVAQDAHDAHLGDTAAGPMQTLLGEYCDALRERIEPLLTPIRETCETLDVIDEAPSQAILPSLRETADQIEILVRKVSQQEAYVLIFGPLKSGKSTLMNAICATYVSEVTALPAYPCLVQVSHTNEEPYYRITRYNGDEEVLAEPETLSETITAEHRWLADAIRSCEEAGETFEPQRHGPSAIRRIELKVPAGDLDRSGAVLVDTPGLYSRMHFGYDRLTREFRDAAACALFVVKTDNLFLEQVFDEFEELLALFSRIFLVVNLDATKRDLKPDGSLDPSLEHADPQAVVRAFENLAMTASLRQARAEGRLRIFPVDLLGAASRRIRAARSGDTSGAIADEPRGQADFEALLAELTAYLNSNEYLRAFVGDSLRRGSTLLGELGGLVNDDSVEALEGRLARLIERQETLGARGEALDRLRGVDWAQWLERHREPLEAAIGERATELIERTRADLDAAVARWFEGEDAFSFLLEKEVEPALLRFRDTAYRIAHDVLEERVSRHGDDEDLASDVRRYLEMATVDPQRVAREALAELRIDEVVELPEQTLTIDDVPVRRRLSDWLMLRPSASVRSHLLGPREAPATPVPAAIKAKRLGSRARKALQTRLGEVLRPLGQRAIEALPAAILDGYIERFGRRLSESLDEIDAATRAELDGVVRDRDNAETVAVQMRTLREITRPAAEDVAELQRRFQHAAPGALDETPDSSSSPSSPSSP